MAARTRKVALTDSWKENIRASMIMNRLVKHVEGEVQMSPTQIKAAQIILAKIVPDLARTEMTGPNGGPIAVAAMDVKGLSDKELDQLQALLSKASPAAAAANPKAR